MPGAPEGVRGHQLGQKGPAAAGRIFWPHRSRRIPILANAIGPSQSQAKATLFAMLLGNRAHRLGKRPHKTHFSPTWSTQLCRVPGRCSRCSRSLGC